MASIRRLKKDVDYLTFAVIADCMNYNASREKNDPEVVNIVKTMVEYRNLTRSKVASRKSFNNKKEVKAYYKGISIDLLKTVDGEFTRLSDLVKKNA